MATATARALERFTSKPAGTWVEEAADTNPWLLGFDMSEYTLEMEEFLLLLLLLGAGGYRSRNASFSSLQFHISTLPGRLMS